MAFGNFVSNDINSMLSQKNNQNINQSSQKHTTEKYHTFDRYNHTFSFVLFYRSTCPHCERFAPIISAFSKDFGFRIYAYTTDGNVLPELNNSMVVTRDIENTFFSNNHNIVVPSLFIVNVKTMQAYFIDQGEMSYNELQNNVTQFFSNMSSYN